RGYAAAIQSDGNIVVAGYSASTYNEEIKDFAVARYLSGNLVPVGPYEVKITADDAEARDYFGRSVSISGDYAVVGCKDDDDKGPSSGSAYIFKREGAGWIQEAKLTASDGKMYAYFGGSVSISGDYAVIGAYDDDYSGSAYVFKRNETSWDQQAKLKASDYSTYDSFGGSVSISGDYAVIGAYGDDDNGKSSGSAYIFKRDGTSWAQQVKLTPNDGSAYDSFGGSVSVSEDYAIIGARGDDDQGNSSGSAYIFKRDGTSWTQQTKLTASDGSQSGCFGTVSISGDYIIVGASGNGGSAYIFKRDGITWNEQVKLTGDSHTTYESFGNSVSILGDYAAVGNYQANGREGHRSGDAYIFKRDGTSWNKQFHLVASDGEIYDDFGISVAVSGSYAIIGAYNDDDDDYENGYGFGSAYIYDMSPFAAEIYSPAPGYTLYSTSATFKWNNSGADKYWLWIGTSEGAYDVYSGDQGTDTSV
ncbi:MAG: hypothetical protein GY751_03485, partial [Bacteroidetes bacterium]|nr:hypothetical protein [Bacteroidota bacterium]